MDSVKFSQNVKLVSEVFKTQVNPAFEKFVPAEQLEGLKQHFASEMPIGRIGQPSDIGRTAVFLASDDSSFMLGAELLVDGGMTYLSK